LVSDLGDQHSEDSNILEGYCLSTKSALFFATHIFDESFTAGHVFELPYNREYKFKKYSSSNTHVSSTTFHSNAKVHVTDTNKKYTVIAIL